MDKICSARRSANMSAIRSRDTKPEIIVRKAAHAMGYRFRLHRSDLPGKPDLVFPTRRKAIFVHGCFWHQHADCTDGRIPQTNQGYWRPKLARTKARDSEHLTNLNRADWNVLVIWECETGSEANLRLMLMRFLAN